MRSLPLIVALLPFLVQALAHAGTTPDTVAAGVRVAVLVGANRPGPGRRPLLHAHGDAERLAETLIAVGQFRRADVHVLRDPTPGQLLSTVARVARMVPRSPGSIFYFYYSGHADEQSLFPNGQPLSTRSIRDALESTPATVRIGMIDACRGGAWTRTKGLTADEAFEVQLPLNPESEGSVLIASSSGTESAHESDVLGASFFTYHFVSGLRGAADRSENGEVTVSEAFEYAKSLTIRDTARVARETQHPSFAMNLRGRQDLVLAQLARSPSQLTLAQANGPLEIIHLDSGISVAELAPGRRQVRLAVPSGRYLVRKVGPEGNLSKEVLVAEHATVRVEEADLLLSATPRLTLKGTEPAPLVTSSTLPRRTIGIGLYAGIGFGWSSLGTFAGSAGSASKQSQYTSIFTPVEGFLQWGITDRLTWAIGTGAVAYRFGDRSGWELVPAGGLLGWGYSSIEGWILQPGVGVSARRWFTPEQALTLEVFTGGAHSDRKTLGANWQAQTTLGWSATVANAVTFNIGVGAWRETNASFVPGNERTTRALGFGSVQTVGLRALPLVQLHLGRGLSLELHTRIRRDVDRGVWQYRTLGGASYVF